MKIQVTKLDKLFSEYIRKRDKVCQRCGGVRNLQTAHFYSRRHQNTRHDPANACLLCFSCHQSFHENPAEFVGFWHERIGNREFDMLRSRAWDTSKPDLSAVEIYLKKEIEKLDGGCK